MLRLAEVVSKCLLRSFVRNKKEYNLKVVLMWPKDGNEGEKQEMEGGGRRCKEV